MEDLQNFIDLSDFKCTMEDKPAKKEKSGFLSFIYEQSSQVSDLQSINKTLDILGMLQQEIKDLKSYLEFTFQQTGELQRDNVKLKAPVESVTVQMEIIQKGKTKHWERQFSTFQPGASETNSSFTGFPKDQNFMHYDLKLPMETKSLFTLHTDVELV